MLQSLGIVISLMALAAAVVINLQPLYFFWAWHFHLGQNVGMSSGRVIAEYQKIIKYLNVPGQKLQLSLRLSQKGMEHFVDVKRLVVIDYGLALLGVCWLVFLWRKNRQEPILWEFVPCLRMINSVFLVIAILAGLDFNFFFIIFHQLLFRNNYWVFDPQADQVIKILPESFFGCSFLLAFLLVETAILVLVYLGKKQVKKEFSN